MARFRRSPQTTSCTNPFTCFHVASAITDQHFGGTTYRDVSKTLHVQEPATFPLQRNDIVLPLPLKHLNLACSGQMMDGIL